MGDLFWRSLQFQRDPKPSEDASVQASPVALFIESWCQYE